jgi:hypothetical protein
MRVRMRWMRWMRWMRAPHAKCPLSPQAAAPHQRQRHGSRLSQPPRAPRALAVMIPTRRSYARSPLLWGRASISRSPSQRHHAHATTRWRAHLIARARRRPILRRPPATRQCPRSRCHHPHGLLHHRRWLSRRPHLRQTPTKTSSTRWATRMSGRWQISRRCSGRRSRFSRCSSSSPTSHRPASSRRGRRDRVSRTSRRSRTPRTMIGAWGCRLAHSRPSR